MLIASALAILLTWAVVAIVLIGVGSLVLRRFDTDYPLVDAFWLGLAASVVLLEIWSLLWPVNSNITILVCCLGAVGLIENRTLVFPRFKTALQSGRWSFSLSFALVLLLAIRASGPSDYYDTGLYGAPMIRWISTYPVVPGLANVHGRFGFNSSVFLCIAALNQGVWKGLGFHLFTGFLMAAIWFILLPACSRLILGTSRSSADWFHSILVIPIGFWTARAPIVGTQTDEPATIASWVAVGILLEQLYRKDYENDRGSGPARLVVATSLFALAVTFKESTIVFALLAWCLAFFGIWSKDRPTKKRNLYVVGALALSAAVVLPWCARGIILSGYPYFPSTAMDLPADWKTPAAVANWYAAGVRSWGRIPEAAIEATRGLAWLRPWWNQAIRDRTSFQTPLLISLASLMVLAGFTFRKKTCIVHAWLWLLAPSLAGAVFWFIVSPALRFAQFAIWTIAGTLGTWAIVCLASGPRRSHDRILLASLSVLLLWCLVSFGWKPPYARLIATRPLAPLPEPRVIARKTLSGLTVYVPAHGNQCWDAPLPCTPYFDETLRLRNPLSMRFGFTSKSQGNQLPKI
jgi:hypothetical protein